MLSNGVYLLLNKGDLTWFLRVLMLMTSGVYEQDSNVTQLGNFKLETIHYSGKSENTNCQIRRSYPAGARFEKTAGFRPFFQI